jgi:hypothetical protein
MKGVDGCSGAPKVDDEGYEIRGDQWMFHKRGSLNVSGGCLGIIGEQQLSA